MASGYSGVLLICDEIRAQPQSNRGQEFSQLIENLESALNENQVQFDRIQTKLETIIIDTQAAIESARIASRVF